MKKIQKLTASTFAATKQYIHEHVDLSEKAETVAAAYVLSTYLVQRFDQLYYLRILGPAGTGKTTLARTLGYICFNPYFYNGLEQTRTLLTVLNEGVTMISDDISNERLRRDLNLEVVLRNGSWHRNFIIYSEKGIRIKTILPFGAKIIVANERFNDPALEARCITIKMGDRLTSRLNDLSEVQSLNSSYEAWLRQIETLEGIKYMSDFRDHRDLMEKLCGFSFEQREVK